MSSFLRKAKDHTERFNNLTMGKLEWIEVNDDKSPVAVLVNGARKVSYTPSRSSSKAGVRPLGNVVIFDFDVKKKDLTPEEQMRTLEKIGMNFTEAIKVRTPSGGLHVYLEWNDDFPIENNVKIESIGRIFNVEKEVEGDIRTSSQLGHAVAPGSVLNNRLYTIESGTKFAKQSKSFCKEISDGLRSLSSDLRLSPESKVSSSRDESRNLKSPLLARLSDNQEVDTYVVNRLRLFLRNKSYKQWHERRADVFIAMSCCYSQLKMIKLWESLDIARDSYRGANISRADLFRDYNRLAKKYSPSIGHSRFCSDNFSKRHEGKISTPLTEKDFKETIEKNLAKARRANSYHNCSVLSLHKVSRALDEGKRRSKHYESAMRVSEDILQPWLNYGKTNILLSDSFLKEFYGWDTMKAQSTKQLLLRKGVIYVSRKQASGRSTAFAVNESFKEPRLSKLLYKLNFREGSNFRLKVNVRSGVIYNCDTGEVVENLHPRTAHWLSPEGGFSYEESSKSLTDYLANVK